MASGEAVDALGCAICYLTEGAVLGMY
ncbi:hypothetical protein CSUI_004339, partial [Cystoisospora suis]